MHHDVEKWLETFMEAMYEHGTILWHGIEDTILELYHGTLIIPAGH